MGAIARVYLPISPADAAVTRAQIWRQIAATRGKAMVVLNIDASLVEIPSENRVGTGPN